MAALDLFAPESGVLDGYGTLKVDLQACSQQLADDLRAIIAMRWLAEVMRHDFETACGGLDIYGPAGTFEGVLSNEDLPNFWRETGNSSGGRKIWLPDARHPIGKWIVDAAARLLPIPSPDVVLDGVLRRNGIEGSREPAPQMMSLDDDTIIVLLHKPKSKVPLPQGVRRDDSYLHQWGRSEI